MPITLARVPVANPTRAPLPYGLLSVAQSPPGGGVHWQNGVRLQPEACGAASSTVDPCPTPPADKTPTVTDLAIRGSEPFTVYSWVDCDDFGDNGVAEGVVRRALEWGEGAAVEQVFWTGNLSPTGGGQTVEPHLAEDTAVIADGDVLQSAATVVGTAVKLKLALGQLEDALADCYMGQGVIHVPRIMGPFLSDGGIVTKQGTQLITLNGNLVVLGTGYTGSSPAGVAGTNSSMWMYATGQVVMLRSDIDVPDFPSSFNRAKNDLVMIAERTYVLAWECCHLAIPVDLTTS
jgi:hypothetical protein